MGVERIHDAGNSEACEDTSTASPVHESTTAPPLGKVLAMGKGDDESSYSKNSTLQAKVKEVPRSALSDALERVTVPSEAGGSVVVVDLGSSSGPNTIRNVAFIVDKLQQRVPKDAEFQAYFNDLPSNDFNNLFQLLSNDGRNGNFFAAGVPGSYFDRLFSRSFVHVFYSSYCLHWLSKVPDEVVDKESPAYNSGQTWIYHSRSAVAKAYQQQALSDLKNFLLARAAEMVPGGLLFFDCYGRATTEPNECGLNDAMHDFGQEDLNEVWSELIAEGLLTEQQRDTFNLPIYLRSVEDVREAITSCGSLFDVLTAEVRKVDINMENAFGTTDRAVLVKIMTSATKAIMNPFVEAHVGKKLAEAIWERYTKVFEKRICTKGLNQVGPMCIVGLIRK